MTPLSTSLQLAPDFTLPDAKGSVFHLRDGLSAGGLLLVFYRGHWCPYCRRYLHKLKANRRGFQALGIDIVAISPEPIATAGALAMHVGIEFPLLSDDKGIAIDAYGVRNRLRETPTPRPGEVLMAHPAVFLINTAGEILFRRVDRNFKRRTPIPTIFRQLRRFGFGAVTHDGIER